MKSGSRDEPGTRLHAEQQFREGAIQILVATEAAGEGINLQVCNILFNYSYCVTNFDASSGLRLERRSMGIWIAL
jgi:superfamily II DNA/RNA helicase